MPILGLACSDQQIFEGLNLVLPAWALLVIAPRWRVTHWVVNLTTFAFCVLYTGLFATLMLQSETTFDFTGFFTYEVNPSPFVSLWVPDGPDNVSAMLAPPLGSHLVSHFQVSDSICYLV